MADHNVMLEVRVGTSDISLRFYIGSYKATRAIRAALLVVSGKYIIGVYNVQRTTRINTRITYTGFGRLQRTYCRFSQRFAARN